MAFSFGAISSSVTARLADEDIAVGLDADGERLLVGFELLALGLRQLDRHADRQQRRRHHEDDEQHEHHVDDRRDVDLAHGRSVAAPALPPPPPPAALMLAPMLPLRL